MEKLQRIMKRFLALPCWNRIGVFSCRVWKAVCAWQGWKRLFALPFALILVLGVLCGGGLVRIFWAGLESHPAAGAVYALSAYCLTAFCVRLPGVLKKSGQWLDARPRLKAMLGSRELRFRLELYLEQGINFAYGIFKTVSGVILGSAWIGCDGIYNLAQALIQLFQILRRRAAGNLVSQWKSYRFCGVLVLLMHLTLTGIVFQTVHLNRAEEQGQIQIIATAAFAFYKIIKSFIEVAVDRKHTRPVDSSVRMLELTQAIFAIFSLQTSMFHTFGTGESWERVMNLLTGCAVCLLIVSTGLYMIRRGNREIKKLQEKDHGK